MRSALALCFGLCAALLAGSATAQPLTSGEIVLTNNVASDSSENAVLRVNPNTGAARPLARIEVLRDAQRLAPTPDGDVYAAQGGLYVYRIDAETGAQIQITRSLQGISDLALAPTGDLLVLENNDHLLRLNPATGATTLESSLSEIGTATRVAVLSNSEVFVQDQTQGRVYHVAGEVQTPIPTPRSFCFDDIAYDPASGFLYGLECGGIAVWRIDPDSGQYDELTRELWLLECCASPPSMEISDGDLLVTTGRSVVRIDPLTGAQELDLFLQPGFGFGDLARGSGASYFLRSGPFVLRFDPAPGTTSGGQLRAVAVQPPFAPSEAPRGVAVMPSGAVLLVMGTGTVAVDPATRAIMVGPAQVADNSNPGAIDVEASGDALTARTGQILRIEGGVGGVEEFASGNNLSGIRSIFRETTGRVLALEADEIVRAFPDGSQSIVTRNQLFATASVRDLTVGPGGNVFVTDGASSSLIRVAGSNPNPDTNQSNVPGGADLNNAWGIATEFAGTLVVAVDNGSCRGVARVAPSVPSTSCFAEGARFVAPFAIAVNAPEPAASAPGLVACGVLALRARSRRARRGR